MIICENFEKCQSPDLECPHKYPHRDGDCGICGPTECDHTEGKVYCLKIILKKKGEEDGKHTGNPTNAINNP